MTIILELMPELESRLSALAAEKGVSVSEYVTHLLGQVPGHGLPASSPAERARLWRDSVRNLPRTPPLSDEAVSRESIYDARG